MVERMTIPQFQSLFSACKTKTQALGCCVNMLSQMGAWSDVDPEVWAKQVLPHKEAFGKLMEKLDEGAGK